MFRMRSEGEDPAAEEMEIRECEPPRRLQLTSQRRRGSLAAGARPDRGRRRHDTDVLPARRDHGAGGERRPGWEYYLDRLVDVETGATRRYATSTATTTRRWRSTTRARLSDRFRARPDAGTTAARGRASDEAGGSRSSRRRAARDAARRCTSAVDAVLELGRRRRSTRRSDGTAPEVVLRHVPLRLPLEPEQRDRAAAGDRDREQHPERGDGAAEQHRQRVAAERRTPAASARRSTTCRSPPTTAWSQDRQVAGRRARQRPAQYAEHDDPRARPVASSDERRLGGPDPAAAGLEEQLVAHRAAVPVVPDEGRPDEQQQHRPTIAHPQREPW